jgi:hypothetical protein
LIFDVTGYFHELFGVAERIGEKRALEDFGSGYFLPASWRRLVRRERHGALVDARFGGEPGVESGSIPGHQT